MTRYYLVTCASRQGDATLAELVVKMLECCGSREGADNLADQVLAQQPYKIRDFLRQTAILDRLTVPLCNAVSGRNDGDALLGQSEQANLFLIPPADRPFWYRYHAILEDSLSTLFPNQEHE